MHDVIISDMRRLIPPAERAGHLIVAHFTVRIGEVVMPRCALLRWHQERRLWGPGHGVRFSPALTEAIQKAAWRAYDDHA